ncbi:MAG: glutathione S-transferase domain-containing protein [Actinobacteria bacterium]|nr:MAG: glutathione S-transferase domain-containing protein [Actinomycetota bacterium]
MAVKLHRCSIMWLKFGGHPCWRVQKALDDAGVEYEVVAGPLSRGKRTRLTELTGQEKYPAIEFEDGTAYRAESKDMAATIREGRLDQRRDPGAGATAQ